MRSERSRRSRTKKEDCLAEVFRSSSQKRGVNMNTAMQLFGYGLAALLFCIAVLGVCHNIKKAARKFLKRQQPHKGDLS
ncbi:hypothetical protein BACCAP_04796 [Pseudoflavonifractor capillosus ATCC 29799]|uniref:Uncharacterized protein n=1 Tax=Pseudoflavonifractor capillosus ATCC 29799 TaxID=411467 RepID=A6P2R3_9FIRM|nr:hypothetical protein [Pseudoflavonifractor capillosus]EDM97385.1 hypothetical protein BACCAP_04796 [Pseudoflavonifractor capillosus ATCC 29799]